MCPFNLVQIRKNEGSFFQGLFEPVSKTISGSCDDTRWLQRVLQIPSIDGTTMFMEIGSASLIMPYVENMEIIS